MYGLGLRLAQHGDLTEAESWWRRAADAGHVNAAHNLAILLREQGGLPNTE
jgi:TPR repeat protein